MKLGLIGDFHLTNRGPERRLDNYFQTGLDKFAQALQIFKANNCDEVLQAADLVDAPTVSNRVKAEIIRTIKENWGKPIYCCYGNHDISGHSSSTVPNSPLAVFESAGVIKLVSEKPELIHWDRNKEGFGDRTPVYVYGSSFGEEVPVPEQPGVFNILITHRMLGDRPLYPGQPLESPRAFLKAYPDYSFVFCGHYHYAFQDRLNDQVMINAGAMLRRNLTDLKFGLEPSVVIFDTCTLKYEIFPLKVQPVKEIFNLAVKEVKDSKSLTQLVEDLKEQMSGEKKGNYIWKSILLNVLKEKNANTKVSSIIDRAIEEVTANGK